MGVDGFGGDDGDEAGKMQKELLSALRMDRKHRMNSNRGEEIIMATIRGDNTVQDTGHYRKVMLRWISLIRNRFTGIVIRRTISSVDNKGSRISGLAPYNEHHLVVKLYDHELKNLELLANELLKENPSKATQFACGSVRALFVYTKQS